MKPIAVVFDTNILFSGIGWRGAPYQCLQLARGGKVELILCREILAEFDENLQSKRKMTSAQSARAVAEILSFCQLVVIQKSLHVVDADPDDDMVLECAIVGGATHIVSGDRHLLDLRAYQNIPILKAADFLTVVEGQGQ